MVYFNSSEELLNYLMTSDFSEQLSPEDLKDLLKEFRNFYRINHSKLNSIIFTMDKTEKENSIIKDRILEMEIETSNTKSEYKKQIDRKLSFKERYLGIIIEKPFRRKFNFMDILKKKSKK